ncbi:hypothetical protein HPB52_025306 [Rhipicephalus sanguineus]|uniref:RNA 3'-terminal phosphate cyclase n=1 Tax=Rhipicephalus sanguineus TaxID=34632 RepID=A0A9D4TDA5_RHISA|nr:hypothetical protein HPB52_025306 [Rhipicephalus sanguineus]
MAVAFSALFRKPVRVTNIRAGRSNPGLRPQHLTGMNLVRDICGGRLVNAVIGSTEIELHPGPIRGGLFAADTGTAGHCSCEIETQSQDRSGFEIHAGDSYASHGSSSSGHGGHGKGITFTIGGGDHHGGGGHHDYGVSPMGVIKNLFLPFLPKPKVNLNGRVVFGVVLEKGVGLGHNQHGQQHHHAVAYHH